MAPPASSRVRQGWGNRPPRVWYTIFQAPGQRRFLRSLPMPHPFVRVEPGPAGYLRVRLDRPARRNALNLGMVHALHAVFSTDPAAPILLDSTDPGVFCAGADLNVSDAERAELSDLLYQCYEVMITRPGPVIAVVSGPAVGGGAQLAGAADLRVAGPDASFRWTGPPG